MLVSNLYGAADLSHESSEPPEETPAPQERLHDTTLEVGSEEEITENDRARKEF